MKKQKRKGENARRALRASEIGASWDARRKFHVYQRHPVIMLLNSPAWLVGPSPSPSLQPLIRNYPACAKNSGLYYIHDFKAVVGTG